MPIAQRPRPKRAALQLFNQLHGSRRFVVLVIADHRLGDLKVIQQLARLAGVFAGHHVALAQHAHSAQRDVLQVADRRGDYI
jgi:hypothetical protein